MSGRKGGLAKSAEGVSNSPPWRGVACDGVGAFNSPFGRGAGVGVFNFFPISHSLFTVFIGWQVVTGWVPSIPLWGGFTRVFYEGSWYFIRGFLLTNNYGKC